MCSNDLSEQYQQGFLRLGANCSMSWSQPIPIKRKIDTSRHYYNFNDFAIEICHKGGLKYLSELSLPGFQR